MQQAWTGLDEDKRIVCTTPYEEYKGENDFLFEYPDDFDFTKQFEYKIVDNELVHDPVPMSEEEMAMVRRQRANEQMNAAVKLFVQTSAASLTDEQAVSVSELFEDWSEESVSYAKDDIVKYNGLLYRCLQPHTSQAGWNPTDAVSLWVRIDEPGVLSEWRRPGYAEECYSEGDKVTWNDKTWISTVPGKNTNSWEPGVYGWDEVTDAS